MKALLFSLSAAFLVALVTMAPAMAEPAGQEDNHGNHGHHRGLEKRINRFAHHVDQLLKRGKITDAEATAMKTKIESLRAAAKAATTPEAKKAVVKQLKELRVELSEMAHGKKQDTVAKPEEKKDQPPQRHHGNRDGDHPNHPKKDPHPKGANDPGAGTAI